MNNFRLPNTSGNTSLISLTSLQYKLCIIILLIIPFALQSQSALNFEQISIEQGLSQTNITSIIQDKNGFLWIGTGDGLNRYDGYNFKIFKHEDSDYTSISNNSIWSLFEGSDGIIWVGTKGGGLNAFNPETETFSLYYPRENEPNSISGTDILSILEDRQGRLWIGTERNGLNLMDRESGTFQHFKGNENYPISITERAIYSLYEDENGIIWAGSYGGLTKIEPEKNAKGFFPTQVFDRKANIGLESDAVRVLTRADSGNIWVGTWNGGLYNFAKEEGIFTSIRHDPNNPSSLSSDVVDAIYQTKNGDLWVGTFSAGLNLMVDQNHFIHYKHQPGNPRHINSDFVFTIFEDRSGVLWIGTYGGGLNKYEPSAERFNHIKQEPSTVNSLSYNLVFGIQEDKNGKIWIATHGGGVDLYDPELQTFEHFKEDPNDPYSISNQVVISMAMDSNENIWVGTRTGLDRLRPDRKGFDHFRNSPAGKGKLISEFIWSLYVDHSGTVWAGTRSGISRFNEQNQSFTNFIHNPDDLSSISSNIVYSILEDKDENLWFGTSKGLNLLLTDKNADTAQFKRFQSDPDDENSISNNFIYSILEDQEGRFWIGTEGGLNRMIEKENGEIQFIHYTTKHGLPNDIIYGILEDDNGLLWVSTNHGISVFDPDELAKSTNPSPDLFRNYELKDGLQSYTYHNGSRFKTRSGELYFGGVNGLNHFHPDKLRDNLFIPQVQITDLKILEVSVPIYKGGEKEKGRKYLEKAISHTDELVLSHRDYSLSFEISALNFDQSQKNQYAYKLDGFDEDWVYIGNRRTVYFTNLDPGTYTFRVRGSNNDGIWNKAGNSLKIKVLPPPWKSWWAISLYLLAGIGLILGYIRYQVRKREEEIETRNRIERAKIEEREIVRKNTSADFHDELGHKLTKISLFMELVRRQIDPQSQIAGYFSKIEKNTQSLSEGMRDLIWILDPEQDSLYDTLTRLTDFGDNLYDHTDITFRTEGISPQLENIPLNISDRRHIVMIFKEAMHNALKYANCTEVNFEVELADDKLIMTFKDNGEGFDLAARSKGYGLKNMQERADKIGAEIQFSSAKGEGTEIQLIHDLPQMRD